MYAAPIGEQPALVMDYSAVIDEITALESWASKRHYTDAAVAARLRELQGRLQVLVTPATKRERRGAPAARKPRSLTEVLDVSRMTRDEMTAELDLIVGYLRMSPSAADMRKLAGPIEALERALGQRRGEEEESVRQRDIMIALTPGGDAIYDFGILLKAIDEMAPDPDRPGAFLLHVKSVHIPLTKEEVDAVRRQAAKTIRDQSASAVYLFNQAYDAYADRKATNREHPIVHGLVKWSTGVDDLDELEMYGIQQQGVSTGKKVEKALKSGQLRQAFFDTVSNQAQATAYAKRVGKWVDDLVGGAGRWVIGLTILKEGLTLLATGGASALTAFRVARGASLLRTTLTIGGATTGVGFAAGAGGSIAADAITGDKINYRKAARAGGTGAAAGGSIGFGGGASAGARNLLGVGGTGANLSRASRIGRTALAEAGASALVNTPGALLQGQPLGQSLALNLGGGAFSGAGGVLVRDLARGRRAFEAAGGAVVGGGSGLTLGLAQGQRGEELAISGAFGALGGGLGGRLERSNMGYLDRTQPLLRPPTMPALGGGDSGGDTAIGAQTVPGTGIQPREPAPTGAATTSVPGGGPTAPSTPTAEPIPSVSTRRGTGIEPREPAPVATDPGLAPTAPAPGSGDAAAQGQAVVAGTGAGASTQIGHAPGPGAGDEAARPMVATAESDAPRPGVATAETGAPGSGTASADTGPAPAGSADIGSADTARPHGVASADTNVAPPRPAVADTIEASPHQPSGTGPRGNPLKPGSQVPANLTKAAKPAIDIAGYDRRQAGMGPDADLPRPGSDPVRPSIPRVGYAPEEPGRYVATGEKPVAGVSASKSRVVQDTQDNDKKYLFKPQSAEITIDRAHERGVRKNQQGPREVAAPMVAEEIGVDAAKGRLVTIDGEPGVLIEWKDKNTLADLAIADPTEFRRLIASEEFRQAMMSVDALDYLVNNLDRGFNFGNYLYEFQGGKLKLTAIDHGLTFTATQERADVYAFTRGLPEEYPPDLVKSLERLDANRAAFIEKIRPYIGDAAVEGFNFRLDKMLADMRARQRTAAP